MTSLADAHIEGQQRIRGRIVQLIAAFWAALGAYDESQVPDFITQAAAAVTAGQRASIALTDAYLARAIGRQPVGINAVDLLAGLRGDVTSAQVYRRPFVTVWTALGAGSEYEQAVSAGLARARATAAMDVQMAHFATYQAVQDADPQIKGYRRKADPGACAFCRLVDGAFVKRADASPLHNGCGCGLVPRLDETTPTPLPEGVAVRTHGELGPVLTDPAHSFTQL